MAQSNLNENIIAWTFENYAAIASALSGIFTCALIFYIYQRSGSVYFLRDLVWKFFGGASEFENKLYEKARKASREVEHYRFEFNIPVQSLEHTELVEIWINENNYTHRDISIIKNYISWKDFRNLSFKKNLFSKNAERFFTSLMGLLMLTITLTLPLTSFDYLMVSLKNAPDVPSFYLSEHNARFSILSDMVLTVDECKTSDSLKKFILPNLSEKNLDTICSLFLDPKYSTYVQHGLREQKGFLFLITFISICAATYTLIRIRRLNIARNLHNKLKLDKQLSFDF